MTLNEQDTLSLIWAPFQHRLNPTSSIWWFFLLCPKQPEGYGPGQMMFTLVSMAGRWTRLNGKQHAGIDLKGSAERFNTVGLGWVYDGVHFHDDLLNDGGEAVRSSEGLISSWTDVNGQQTGGEIRHNPDRPFGLSARFMYDKGRAEFDVWGDPKSEMTRPMVGDYHSRLGGFDMVSNRRFNFAGEFSHPTGSTYHEGYGYFQFVHMKMPLFPWKWLWVVFEDGSVASCSGAYLGPQALRQGDHFYPNWLERSTLGIRMDGYFYHAPTNTRTDFEVEDKQILEAAFNGQGSHPHFVVKMKSRTGEFIEFRVEPYHMKRVIWERPFLMGQSRFHYHEYVIRVAELRGEVKGQTLNTKTLGNGFGSCEYTWGLGIANR